jgi:hypothetical protein
MNKLRLAAERNPARWAVEFWLIESDGDGNKNIGTSVLMEPLPDGSFVRNPTFSLSEDDAQEFIDRLWESGFRPSGMSAETLTAQGRHLEDMRRIAFQFIEGLKRK